MANDRPSLGPPADAGHGQPTPPPEPNRPPRHSRHANGSDGKAFHYLSSQVNTRKEDLRIESALVGKRVLVAAHKLPAALDALLKGINPRINQLDTPRQVYDLSFEAHLQLLTLHPLGAGNGPITRLLMKYIQYYHQRPLSLVYVDLRPAYLTSLVASWSQKTAVPIVSILHSQLQRQASTCLPISRNQIQIIRGS